MIQDTPLTRCIQRRTRRLEMAFAAIALASAVPAGAALRTWPGPSPCNTTLQACLDAADAGDIVEVASDGPVTGPIELYRKSLTLRAAAGFSPVFQAGSFTNVIDAFGADTLVAIVIEGLTIRGGTINAYQAGTGPFGLTVRDNTVEADGLDANRTGIRLATFGGTPNVAR